MRAIMLFRLFEEHRLTQRALVEKLLQADVFRRETKLLGVHQFDSCLPACRDHAVGFAEVQAERLFADNMFAGARGVQRDRAVHIIRRADDDHVERIQLQHLAIVGKVAGDAEFSGERLGMAWRWRCDRDQVGVRTSLERLCVD
jgi:hypothetical protein